MKKTTVALALGLAVASPAAAGNNWSSITYDDLLSMPPDQRVNIVIGAMHVAGATLECRPLSPKMVVARLEARPGVVAKSELAGTAIIGAMIEYGCQPRGQQ